MTCCSNPCNATQASNGEMTVRGGMTITSSSRCLLAGSMLRDTAAV
ncbi:hypothetical protein [Wolbachia endosymbiont (group A) of Rhinocyllus conicus]|nr:hypothetical protein [Wolbachia endosymbiont (group A) of Rhinocyllus conicus]